LKLYPHKKPPNKRMEAKIYLNLGFMNSIANSLSGQK